MKTEEIQKLTSNGFKPFTLHLSDGRTFTVPHPDYIAISRHVVVVIGEDELANLIDPVHIVSAKQMGSQAPH